ncbi:maleylacetoacetate isomerase [Tistlia consotensis]|uniref:Maleylacetoacetate isomerase n=1 Tax=Tistlia consotensis USBA 355 TaxID=560819 RepID=A0A1Y6CEU8_9PROT|nr:maleylacetoacetate isomerase [Tistlia consotensis]SMF48737.1 maleylacetoacetate isomerase [Tistlia consotensis USBA 355]SNR80814.1 maleylacetoacetate isomerase [Tistlia consotensis]
MELYGFFRSSTSYRLRIALALKGIEYEAHAVSLPRMEHRSPEYLAVNPQGLLPTLVDEGRAYAQSLAILEYLDERYPEPPFLPDDAAGRAVVRSLAQVVACEIHPLNNVRVLKYLQATWNFSDADRDAWYRHWMAEGLQKFEATLAHEGCAGRFCFGDRPGLADICLVPQIFNAKRFDCPLEAYPATLAIFGRCLELEAFETTQPKYQPDAF